MPILDSLRAIAALSVCLFHFVCGPINFIQNDAILSVFDFGLYGVQMFFVISGFVIPFAISKYRYHVSSYFKFIGKRFLRLEPPYLVSILLVIIFFYLRKLYSVTPDIRLPELNLNQILLHFGYLIPFTKYTWMNRVYWTLAIEFQFYLFMGLFYFIITNKNLVFRLIGYMFCIAISIGGSSKFLFYWLPLFLLGNLIFLYLSNFISKTEFYFVSFFVLVFISFFMPTPILFACLIPSIGILYFANFEIPLLNWVGKISYSIYLTHAIVGLATINVLSKYSNNLFEKFLVIVVGLVITFVFSLFLYYLIEKPSKGLSSKIKI